MYELWVNMGDGGPWRQFFYEMRDTKKMAEKIKEALQEGGMIQLRECRAMASKTNIRSIRFSDELGELIERQPGQNFTEKFENLVTRCVWEQPAREKELAELERRIREKRQQLQEMSAQAGELGAAINELFPKVLALESAIDKAVKQWEV